MVVYTCTCLSKAAKHIALNYTCVRNLHTHIHVQSKMRFRNSEIETRFNTRVFV